MQPPLEVLTIYSLLGGRLRGWARSPCLEEGPCGKEEEANGYLIAIQDIGIDPQVDETSTSLVSRSRLSSGSEQSRKEPGSGGFGLKLQGVRVALLAHLLPELFHLDTNRGETREGLSPASTSMDFTCCLCLLR